MGISTVDLYQIAGFNTAQVAGFQAQLASGRWKRQVLWPEQLKCKRYEDFCYASSVARAWMAVRMAYPTPRRSASRNPFKNFDATPTLQPEGLERMAEQTHICLKVMNQ